MKMKRGQNINLNLMPIDKREVNFFLQELDLKDSINLSGK